MPKNLFKGFNIIFLKLDSPGFNVTNQVRCGIQPLWLEIILVMKMIPCYFIICIQNELLAHTTGHRQKYIWQWDKSAYFRQTSIFIWFFPNRRTLKFLELKCNPTNKKTVA